MNMIRKRCAALIALLTMCTGILQAVQACQDCSAPCGDVHDCCCEPICCRQADGRFFAGADLLYWKPRVQGIELDFGSSSIVQATLGNAQATVTEELDLDPKFKWNAGYRIAAGYQFACSDLEIDGFWTHFQSTGHRCVSGARDLVNHGKYRVKLDQFDVVLAYNISLASCMTFKPFFGVRGTRIAQRVNAVVTTDILIEPDVLTSGTRTWDDRQRFTGAGPVFGFQGDWDMGKDFGVYGAAAGSVLYGFDKVHFDDSESFSAPISQVIFSDGRKNTHRYNCNMDLALGVRWQTCVMDRFQVVMKLGFEHHQYFDTSSLGVNRDDLCFDGGIFSVDVAF